MTWIERFSFLINLFFSLPVFIILIIVIFQEKIDTERKKNLKIPLAEEEQKEEQKEEQENIKFKNVYFYTIAFEIDTSNIKR